MEAIRTHLGHSCVVLGIVLVILGALLSPGTDLYAAAVYELAGAMSAVVIYVLLRPWSRRPN